MKAEYKVIAANISDASRAPKGHSVFYRCKKCGGSIPSQPEDNVGCPCGNIVIDIDYFRLDVNDFGQFEVVKRIE